MLGLKKYLSFATILATATLVGFYIYRDVSKPIPAEVLSDISTSTQVSVGTNSSNDSGYTVKIIDSKPLDESGFKAPNIDAPFVNKGILPPEAFSVLYKNVAELVQELKEGPDNEEKWLQLGIFRKMNGEYSEAAAVFEYVSRRWPADYVPYSNLADIYQFYLKKYPLAEKNWLKTTELKPEHVQAYVSLYTLYQVYGGEGEKKGLSALLQGLERNRNSVELMVHTARHYRVAGDTEKAIYYYNKAIQEAGISGQEASRDSLVEERDEIAK